MHVFNLYLLLSLFKFLGRYRHLLLSHLNDDTITWEASRPIVSSNQKFLGSPVPCELGVLDSLPEDALLFWSGPFEMSLFPAVLVLHFQRLREREQWQVLVPSHRLAHPHWLNWPEADRGKWVRQGWRAQLTMKGTLPNWDLVFVSDSPLPSSGEPLVSPQQHCSLWQSPSPSPSRWWPH